MNYLLQLPAAIRSAQSNGCPPGGHPNPSVLGSWLRGLCLTGLLLLSFLAANAQTTWTARSQTAGGRLTDVAYDGIGRYVSVGDDGLIRVSTDGVTWTTQVPGGSTNDGLNAIVYAAGKFVTVGYGGRMLTSTNGLTWTAQVSGTVEDLRSIAYGGGRFIAVGDGGIAITSTDGVSWTTLTTGTSLRLLAITYGSNLFVVAGQDGLIRTTPNGIIWTARTSGTTHRFYGITTGSGGSFVAVGDQSAIATSPNGITWTLRPVAGTAIFFSYVAYHPFTKQYVAVSTTANRLATSDDGVTWTAGPSGTSLSLYGVRHIDGRFIAVGTEGTIRSSLHGLEWEPLTITSDIELRGVAHGNSRYVAVGSYPKNPDDPQSGRTNVAITSGDGLSFVLGKTDQINGVGNGFYDVAFGNGLFATVGVGGNIQTSADGQVWVSRYNALIGALRDIAYGGGQFVAVGDAGLVVRSTDGIHWIAGSSIQGAEYFRVTYANSQFVAVGNNGVIGTSPNGLVWTARTSGTPENLESVAYGNGTYVAVGFNLPSPVRRSADGVTWTAGASLGGGVFDVTFGNGQFVALVQGLSIFTSPDGLAWTARTSNSPGFLRGLAHGNGHFVAVGNKAAVVTSPDYGQPPVNQAPIVANSIPNQVATVGQGFSFGIPANTFTDPNGDALTLSASGLPNGLSLNGSILSGTPTAQGTSTVTVTTTDPGNLSASTQFTITVSAAPGNPGNFAITGVTLVNCQAVSATQRQLVFTPQYTGTNGQPITFSVANESLPTTNAGPYTLNMYTDNPAITLKAVQSGTAGQASFVYNWLAVCNGVPPVNQPPVAPFIANASGTVGQVFSQSIPLFIDPEGKPLTYSITGVPPGLLVTNGGNLVGPPTTAGVYPITVTATDPGGLSASTTYTLTLNPAGGNPAAFAITGVALVSCQAVSATQRQLIFTPQYTGTNGQPITFSVANESLPTTNSGPYTLKMYTDNPTITLKAMQSGTAGQASFVYNWLTVCNNGNARLGFEVETELAVRVLGNPVGHTVSVEVSGAEGGALSLSLMDMTGRVVARRGTEKARQNEPFAIDVSAQPAGMLLLLVSTASQTKTIRLLKNQ